MKTNAISATAALAVATWAAHAHAAQPSELAQIQQEIAALRQSYDQRIAALEARLREAEEKATAAANAAVAPPPAAASPSAGANAFNPALSLILSGTYASLQRDPEDFRIAGFIPGGEELGPGPRGFSLGESELGVYANVDPWFWGGLNLALTPENEAEVEEAFLQTTALPYGLTVKFGRAFSGIGYLNSQHAHTWDFVDAPLAYQAFLGKQFGDDGVALRWLAPTDLFVELGAELGRGRNFPGSDRDRNGAGAQALFAHLGGDLGVSSNWRAGVSWLRTTPREREFDDQDLAGNEVLNSFSGTSRLWIVDGVWKWAPNGNATRTNFKLQGEWFWRREDGSLNYDVDGAASPGRYASRQSGGYLQAVYQFVPAWRVGLRYDRLHPGSADFGANAAVLATPDHKPSRGSLMFDWSPSEFSRWRLQLARDKSRADEADNELFLQYQMSLGAHGAHSY